MLIWFFLQPCKALPSGQATVFARPQPSPCLLRSGCSACSAEPAKAGGSALLDIVSPLCHSVTSSSWDTAAGVSLCPEATQTSCSTLRSWPPPSHPWKTRQEEVRSYYSHSDTVIYEVPWGLSIHFCPAVSLAAQRQAKCGQSPHLTKCWLSSSPSCAYFTFLNKL